MAEGDLKLYANLKRFSECPICFERLIPPVSTCKNGHVVCRNCRKKMANCPSCRSAFSKNKNTFLNELLEAIPAACKYEASGCALETTLIKIKEHEKNCHYREEICYCCREKFCYHKVNDHFNTHHFEDSTKIYFSRKYSFTVYARSNGGSSYIALASAVDIYFLHRFVKYWEEKKIILGVQYLGKREEAHKYCFDVEIDQQSPTANKKFFTCSGICMPYICSKDELKKHKRAITLKLNEIFLSDECPENFTITFRINRVKD